MTFGYSLLGALLLLLPGFAFLFGFRVGETSDLVSPRPDPPNSNLSVFIIVLGALLSHVAGSFAFSLNEWLASRFELVHLGFDPNPYKALLLQKLPENTGSFAISFELLYFLLLTVAAFFVARKFAAADAVTATSYPARFGWLQPVVAQVEAGSHIAIGFVRTTSCHNGMWIGYEGLIRRLSTDDDNALHMVVLEQCDRFLVAIDGKELRRLDTDGQQIAVMHFRENQIADFAVELFEYPEILDADENAPVSPDANARQAPGG